MLDVKKDLISCWLKYVCTFLNQMTDTERALEISKDSRRLSAALSGMNCGLVSQQGLVIVK